MDVFRFKQRKQRNVELKIKLKDILEFMVLRIINNCFCDCFMMSKLFWLFSLTMINE